MSYYCCSGGSFLSLCSKLCSLQLVPWGKGCFCCPTKLGLVKELACLVCTLHHASCIMAHPLTKFFLALTLHCGKMWLFSLLFSACCTMELAQKFHGTTLSKWHRPNSCFPWPFHLLCLLTLDIINLVIHVYHMSLNSENAHKSVDENTSMGTGMAWIINSLLYSPHGCPWLSFMLILPAVLPTGAQPNLYACFWEVLFTTGMENFNTSLINKVLFMIAEAQYMMLLNTLGDDFHNSLDLLITGSKCTDECHISPSVW